jgi:ethanolamine transporter EutH
MGWLDQYQKGRFEVYVDTSGLDKSVDKIGALGRMIVIATILVGLLIGSAIATSVLAFIEPASRIWDFTFRLSYLGFVAAMVIAIVIVLRLVWRWIRGKDPLRD